MFKAKRKLKKLLSALGIRKYNNIQSGIRNNMSKSYAQLKKLGFNPKTVIDIGIANGTPELYKTFHESTFLLVEPLKEYENVMKNILRKYMGSYILAAAGSENKEVEFNVHTDHLSGSSILEESMGQFADGNKRIVDMVKIDDVIDDKKLQGSFLLKIDVQGFELNVLEGCKKVLQDTEAVALEVSLFKFMKDAPDFYDVVYYMKNNGFVVYDIELAWNRPLDNALGQVNMLFVKENGMFRKNHYYATKDQYKKQFK